jgi:hypothetical protein
LFRQRFPVRLFGEGTIRGTGGIAVVDADCGTGVAGLYAAGDAATRELVAGAISGGGAVNSAWALASGRIAGAAAAPARRRASRSGEGAGRPGLRASGRPGWPIHGRCSARSRRKCTAMTGPCGAMLPRWANPPVSCMACGTDRRPRPATRSARPDGMAGHGGDGGTARWCTAAAAAAGNAGIAVRSDRQAPDPALAHRLLVGGLDKVWTKPATPAARRLEPRCDRRAAGRALHRLQRLRRAMPDARVRTR